MKKMSDYILIQHPGGCEGIRAYDWLVKAKADKEVIKKLGLEKGLYKLDCEYVGHFQKLHKGYRYIGSEDTGHIPSFNSVVAGLLIKSIKNGFQVIAMVKNKGGKITMSKDDFRPVGGI